MRFGIVEHHCERDHRDKNSRGDAAKHRCELAIALLEAARRSRRHRGRIGIVVLRQIGALLVPLRIELRGGRLFKLNFRKALPLRLRQDASGPSRASRFGSEIIHIARGGGRLYRCNQFVPVAT